MKEASGKHPQQQEAYDTHFLIAPEPEGNYRLYVNFEANTFSLEVTITELEQLSKQLNEFVASHSSAPQPAEQLEVIFEECQKRGIELSDLREERDNLLIAVDKAEQRIAGVIAATRPILESLEWSGTHDLGDEDNWAVLTKDICPWCYGKKKDGHKPECELGKAISLLRGDGKP